MTELERNVMALYMAVTENWEDVLSVRKMLRCDDVTRRGRSGDGNGVKLRQNTSNLEDLLLSMYKPTSVTFILLFMFNEIVHLNIWLQSR